MTNYWNSFKQFLKDYQFNWKYKLFISLPIIIGLIAFDWISKAIVVSNMEQGQTITIIPGFIKFHYTINPGAAYGMNAEYPSLAITIATISTIAITIIFLFLRDGMWLTAVGMMLAGSIANLIARAWAPPTQHGAIYGGVVDFLQFDFTFLGQGDYIFNLADLWVSIAVIVIIVAFIIYMYKNIKLAIYKKHEQKHDLYFGFLENKEILINNYWSNFYKKEEWKHYKKYKEQIKKLKLDYKNHIKEFDDNGKN